MRRFSIEFVLAVSIALLVTAAAEAQRMGPPSPRPPQQSQQAPLQEPPPPAEVIVLDQKSVQLGRFEVFREQAVRALRALQEENAKLRAKNAELNAVIESIP